ncbi:unnamed protein product [Ranitomeya imitator]|uniref:Uncharacterized protein n=1 Tax=Ranitomeya imitator TaxID=111125 RepID=A0ABN9L7N4_9NEOB|nr:unnamed protein product [Ranitomeya imitator]
MNQERWTNGMHICVYLATNPTPISTKILENFKIETNRMVEVGTTFNLILFPSKPIQLTLSPLSLNGSERHS